MWRALMILIASAALATATAVAQQRGARSTIDELDELTASQIADIDRARTIFILPVGMLATGPGWQGYLSSPAKARRPTDVRLKCGG